MVSLRNAWVMELTLAMRAPTAEQEVPWQKILCSRLTGRTVHIASEMECELQDPFDLQVDDVSVALASVLEP